MRRLLRSQFLKKYTWQVEAAFLAAILLAVFLVSGNRPIELIGSAAVLFTFMYVQVTERLTDAQEEMDKPQVACHFWARRYFFLKETMWLFYFTALGAWSALVGVIIFLAYPFWRDIFKKANPQDHSN